MGLLIVITAFGMIAFGLPDGALGVAWPSMSTSFGVSLAALGSIAVVFTSTYAASGFLSGWFLSRISLGAVLAVSASIMGAGFLGYALMPAWWTLLIAVGVAGLGGGILDAAMNVFAAVYLSTRGTNWLHSAFSLGAFAGAPVMTGLLVAGVDWRWGFVGVGGSLGQRKECQVEGDIHTQGIENYWSILKRALNACGKSLANRLKLRGSLPRISFTMGVVISALPMDTIWASCTQASATSSDIPMATISRRGKCYELAKFTCRFVSVKLNPAAECSELLRELGTINAVKLWLTPFKFVGMANLFTGIGLALETIVQVLRWQSNRHWNAFS